MVPDSKSARSFASSSPWLPEAAQLCAAAAARHERALSMTSSAQRTSDRPHFISQDSEHIGMQFFLSQAPGAVFEPSQRISSCIRPAALSAHCASCPHHRCRDNLSYADAISFVPHAVPPSACRAWAQSGGQAWAERWPSVGSAWAECALCGKSVGQAGTEQAERRSVD